MNRAAIVQVRTVAAGNLARLRRYETEGCVDVPIEIAIKSAEMQTLLIDEIDRQEARVEELRELLRERGEHV